MPKSPSEVSARRQVPVPCLSLPVVGALISPCGEVEVKDEPTTFTTAFGNFTAPGKAARPPATGASGVL